jgi:hypothetical protein
MSTDSSPPSAPKPGDRWGAYVFNKDGWWVLDPSQVFYPEVPKDPGAYWWKPTNESKYAAELIHLIEYRGCLVAEGKSRPIHEWGGVWSAPLVAPPLPCQWTLQGASFQTGCGCVGAFPEGETPVANEYKFCPLCGGKITYPIQGSDQAPRT